MKTKEAKQKELAIDLVRKNGYNDYIVGDVLICKTGEVK